MTAVSSRSLAPVVAPDLVVLPGRRSTGTVVLEVVGEVDLLRIADLTRSRDVLDGDDPLDGPPAPVPAVPSCRRAGGRR